MPTFVHRGSREGVESQKSDRRRVHGAMVGTRNRGRLRLSRAAKPKRTEAAGLAAERRAVQRNSAALGTPAVEPVSPAKKVPRRGSCGRVVEMDELGDGDFARRIRNRIKAHLSRLRREMQVLEAFTCEGWGKSKARAVEASAEVERAGASVVHLKNQIKASFAELEARYAGETPLTDRYTDSGLSEGDIVCSRCGSADTPTGNEILLCDGAKCDRAYHQKCLRPAVSDSDAAEDPDVDWFCPCCDTKLELLDAIREEFEENAHVDDWRDLFPSADTSRPVQVDSGTSLQSPSPEVKVAWPHQVLTTTTKEQSNSRGGGVASQSPRHRRRKRVRPKVDYVSLNAALFTDGDEANAMAMLEEDDEEYQFEEQETTPCKPRRKPKARRAQASL